MSGEWIPVTLTFVGTAMLVASVLVLSYETWFHYRAALQVRLNEVNARPDKKSSLLLDFKRLVDSSRNPSDWQTWLSDLLRQSGSQFNVRWLFATSLCSGLLLLLAAAIATCHWPTSAAALVVGLAVPLTYLCTRRKRRARQLALQLPDVLDFICRAVRAGQTVPASFQMVADDFPPPIADEFRYCYEQQNLGISYSTALRNLARSSGITELRILVMALLVQARLGGNLTDLLENLASMLRKRIVLQQKVRAITGEGRMQALVLIALPFVVFVAMYVFNRNYAQVLLDHPWLLVGCILSQAVGAALIYKMIQIDY